jgi:hypothetical protein
MTPPVKLSDRIDAMDFQSEESHAYLHTVTGAVVIITDEEVRG